MEHVTSTTLRQQLQQQHAQSQQHQTPAKTQLHHHTLQKKSPQKQKDQLQYEQKQQQQQCDNQQQFCLRWHNHQTSLLSSLPILLDQSHLTDVTLSAEGRTLRAHRVVLSACSTFFLELFRALDTANHPVIIIPGASFAAIVALLTFMYSGEVNVYEEQIPMLLNLAETLGIKGLADVQNNLQKSVKRHTETFAEHERNKLEVNTPPTPLSPLEDFATHQQHQRHASPLLTSSLTAPAPNPPLPPPHPLPSASPLALTTSVPSPTPAKTPTPLESLFLKSLQFYPNLLPQPLNFSQSALNKTSEFLAKYQQHCNFYQNAFSGDNGGGSGGGIGGGISPQHEQQVDEVTAGSDGITDLPHHTKRLCVGEKRHQQHHHHHHQHQQQQKDIKCIDKIVENLRSSNKAITSDNYITPTQSRHQQQEQQQQQQQQQQEQQPEQQHQQQSQHQLQQELHQQLQQQLSPHQLNLKTSIANFTPNLPSPSSSSSFPTQLSPKSPIFTSSIVQQHHQIQQQQQHEDPSPTTPQHSSYLSPDDKNKLQQQLESFGSNSPHASTSHKTEIVGNMLCSTEKLPATMPASPQSKTPSNSKLYATCFICHKQLSNQYNLRVHLETHQNVRYACNVCTHVSRSKDALRKHVSYRHPGIPSPCESETRRKRAKTVNVATSSSAPSSSAATSPSPTSAPITPFQLMGYGGGCGGISDLSVTEMLTPPTGSTSVATSTSTALTSSPFLFLPNQFHLAAAAAAAAAAAVASGQHSENANENNNYNNRSNINKNNNSNRNHCRNGSGGGNTSSTTNNPAAAAMTTTPMTGNIATTTTKTANNSKAHVTSTALHTMTRMTPSTSTKIDENINSNNTRNNPNSNNSSLNTALNRSNSNVLGKSESSAVAEKKNNTNNGNNS